MAGAAYDSMIPCNVGTAGSPDRLSSGSRYNSNITSGKSLHIYTSYFEVDIYLVRLYHPSTSVHIEPDTAEYGVRSVDRGGGIILFTYRHLYIHVPSTCVVNVSTSAMSSHTRGKHFIGRVRHSSRMESRQ